MPEFKARGNAVSACRRRRSEDKADPSRRSQKARPGSGWHRRGQGKGALGWSNKQEGETAR